MVKGTNSVVLGVGPLSALCINVSIDSGSGCIYTLSFFGGGCVGSSFTGGRPKTRRLTLGVLRYLGRRPSVAAVITTLRSASICDVRVTGCLSSYRRLVQFGPCIFILGPGYATGCGGDCVKLNGSSPVSTFIVTSCTETKGVRSRP